MKKSIILALAFVAPCVLLADTLLWYRFGGEGATIENVANPGVMDGTLKSISSSWNGTFDDVSDQFPARCDAFTNDVRVIDPKTDALYPRVKALSWTGDKNHTGAVVVPAANLTADFKNMTNITYEAFFKVSQAAIDRAAGGGNTMFPIVFFGNDTSTTATGQGLIFSIYYKDGELCPFCRFYYDQSDNTPKMPSVTANWAIDSISLDEWHHAALVINGSTGKYITYLDWNETGSGTIPDFHGIRYDSANGRPLVIGANPYNSGRVFLGELAEVRITDRALAKGEFLRPVPPGPVDADTLVYLPLGDTPWFAHAVPLTKGIWNVPLNGAPTAVWDPTGWATAAVEANLPCGIPTLADEAHGPTVRGGCLDTNAMADVKSITFSSATAIVNSGNLGHIIEFPKDGLTTLYAGDFTFEWFFKTDYQSNQAMLVNPWTKVMINGGKVHPRIGDYNSGGGAGSAVVNDGQWHHCALVYRHDINTFECWVDYKLDSNPRVADALKSTTTQGFFFGGQGYNSQVFNGQLDDLRITKRALAPHEFLTTIPVATDTSTTDILHATLEGSLSSGQDEFFVSNGVVRVVGTNAKSTASYADILLDIDYDNDGKADTTSTKALVLDGSRYLDFTAPATWYTRDFTLEFFAKVTGEGNGAQLVRLAPSTAIGNSSRWALSPVGTVSILRSAKGTYNNPTSLSSAANPALTIVDGKWHHWAVTLATDYSTATTTVKVYCDYAEVAGGSFADSVIYFSTYTHSLLVGYSGNADGGVQGQFDEIRFRPGVQPVSSFMRRVPGSRRTILILR